MSEFIKRLSAFALCVTLVIGAPASVLASGTTPRPTPGVGTGAELEENADGDMQASTDIAIDVTGILEITGQTEDCYIKEGADQELIVAVSGIGPFKYTWEVSIDNGATWQPAEGATDSEKYQITDAQLNPDKQTDPYTYRVTVEDVYGDTVSTEIKITVQEEFAYRRILDPEDNVAVSAWMLKSTELSSEPIPEGSDDYDTMKDELPDGYLPVNAVDLGLYNDVVEENYFTGKQTVEFIVGEEYDGEEVVILQIVDGAVVKHTAVVEDGIASIEVDSLSQFMVAVESLTNTITVTAGEGGSVQPSGKITVENGEDQTIVFLPDEGYVVDQVLVDGQPVEYTGNSYTFTDVKDDHTVDVSFKKVVPTGETHTVTVNVGKNGTASPEGEITVDDGESLTITITPKTGYAVDKVLVNGVEWEVTGSYLTIPAVTEDMVVDISFIKSDEKPTKVEHTITATAGEGGKISPEGTTTVGHGGEAYYYIVPDEGYVIDKVYIDGVEVDDTDGTYHFINVVSNHTIHATFKEGDTPEVQYYTIWSLTRGGGTISPEGYTTVPAGGSQTFHFTPKPGYVVKRVWVNGKIVATTGDSYTITDIHRDTTIRVTFGRGGSTLLPTGDITTGPVPVLVWVLLGSASAVAVLMIILIIVRRKRDDDEDDQGGSGWTNG